MSSPQENLKSIYGKWKKQRPALRKLVRLFGLEAVDEETGEFSDAKDIEELFNEVDLKENQNEKKPALKPKTGKRTKPATGTTGKPTTGATRKRATGKTGKRTTGKAKKRG